MRSCRTTTAVALAVSTLLLPAAPAWAAPLNLNPDLTILAANLIVFALLVYPTSRLVLRPIVRVLEERERRTEGALEQARGFTAELGELRAEFDSRLRAALSAAQSRRAELAAESEQAQRRLAERAREDASRIVESVRASIAEEQSAARESLRGDARELARLAATRILGRPL